MFNNLLKQKPRVFSGIQPSGTLHIGNYLGAIRPWVLQQDEKESYFCIVDMHALTVPQDPVRLQRMTREVSALYVASGIDPQKSTIFVQSHVRAHAECCWILNCVTPLGWLERMTQFKAKSKTQENVSIGLLDYPVLQAADILLYDTDEVPVGEDQKQHVELTRDIAQRFNRIYGETFVIPKTVIPNSGARIRAFNDPSKKMSKTEAHIQNHAIRLTDKPDQIRRVIQSAVTDTGREIRFSNSSTKAGINNLLEIYELLTNKSRPEIERHFEEKGYADLKKEVAEVMIETLHPIQKQYTKLIADLSELDRILNSGAERARSIAEPKITKIKHKIGWV